MVLLIVKRQNSRCFFVLDDNLFAAFIMFFSSSLNVEPFWYKLIFRSPRICHSSLHISHIERVWTVRLFKLFELKPCLIWRFINNSNCNWFCFWNKKFDEDIFYFIWNTIFSIVANLVSNVTDYTSTLSVSITSNGTVSVNGNFWITNRVI